MRVGLGEKTRPFGTIVRRPMGAKAEKETLVGGEAVNVGRRRFSGKRFLEGGVGDHQPAEVRDAFAFFELAVAVQARLNLKRVELLGDAIAARLEILQVFRSPPAIQIA